MVSLCDDLLRFTRSSLDYAAIAQGSRPLCLGSFTIGALVHEIDRQFAPIARSRRIKWESHAQQSGIVSRHRRLAVPADLRKPRLERLEVHSPRRASAHRRRASKPSSGRLAVSDSGPGIPSPSHERVFEPFVRLARDERSGSRETGSGWPSAASWSRSSMARSPWNRPRDAARPVTVRFPIGPRTAAADRQPPQRI